MNMDNRYLRNKDLIDQSRLDEITVIGAGGIGSALLQNAAIMGFKKIIVWDPDMLEEHNLSTTSWPEGFLNMPKVAATEIVLKRLNKKISVDKKPHYWENGFPLSNKVFLTPDNMEVRLKAYETWKKNPNREWLIDMRMGALGFEIITVTRESDYFMDSYVPSSEIADDPCTAKHTIFCGSLAASYGLSQAFNVLDNRLYYAYIWGSLGPVSLRREHLVKPTK
tara:strand:+ start:4109 stop:4777 length:669 start_codon:yes stop_codon:yes gene_type:complete